MMSKKTRRMMWKGFKEGFVVGLGYFTAKELIKYCARKR